MVYHKFNSTSNDTAHHTMGSQDLITLSSCWKCERNISEFNLTIFIIHRTEKNIEVSPPVPTWIRIGKSWSSLWKQHDYIIYFSYFDVTSSQCISISNISARKISPLALMFFSQSNFNSHLLCKQPWNEIWSLHCAPYWHDVGT